MLSYLLFFNDTATNEIYTLSLHDALPICPLRVLRRALRSRSCACSSPGSSCTWSSAHCGACADRKSTRLNSSHLVISYAVFCLKKNRMFSNLPHDFLTLSG